MRVARPLRSGLSPAGRPGAARANAVAPALLLAAVAVLPGCMYADGTRGYTLASDYRPGIRTVAVPIWNRAMGEYRRDLEIRLTEALCKRIESDSPYKVTDRRGADTLLMGTVGVVEERVMSFDPLTGNARELQLRLIVDFTWTDLRTGEVMVDLKGFRVASDIIPTSPFNEDFFQGSQDALGRIAQRIVEQLKNPW